MNTTLKELLARYADCPWFFVRPGGNWGDYLIYAGAEKMAAELGLDWQTCSAEALPEYVNEGRCIYLHGSGGYNSWCSGRPFDDLARAVRCRGATVVQGPCTVEVGSDAIAQRLRNIIAGGRCNRLVLFARERVSFDTLRQFELDVDGVELAIDHDTALGLTRDAVLRMGRLIACPRARYRLVVQRKDDESPSSSSTDAGDETGVLLDPVEYCGTFEHWIRVHAFAESIDTNRLHSAILGALLGKPTRLRPGAYHKNESVWLYSLAGRGIEWCSDPIRRRPRLPWLPGRLRNSHKLQRFVNRARGVPIR